MKIFVRTLLVIAVVALAYLCTMSIITPIKFEQEMELREKEVVKKLIDIRKVEIEYKNQKGRYTAGVDTLIDFIKNGRLPVVMKEGTLTDEQLKDGLTEAKAAAIIRKGNKKEIEALGLQGFKRDTSYISVYENLFAKEYTLDEIDKIFEIPFSGGKKFDFATAIYVNPASGISIPLFEAKALFQNFLGDLNRQELINLIDTKTKLDKFPGLQVGSIVEPNNNAGNWE